MSTHDPAEDPNFMDWLEERVESDPEATLAAQEEELRLFLTDALRRARAAARMTQALVAQASGLKQSVVSRLENPDHNPTIETVLRYLRAVDADLVVSVVVDDQTFPATTTARRAVVLPESVARKAEAEGVDLRDYVLGCVARQSAAQEATKTARGRERNDRDVHVDTGP